MINIKKWSDDNKLCLNLDKTKEVIFRGPHPSKLCITPPTICDVERVSSAKLLGIYFTDKTSMSDHIQHTVSVSNQRLYLLCQLKRQNLPVECLDRIFDAIVISNLMYASPSWFGYISVEQLNIIRKLFVKAHRWGLTKNCTTLMSCLQLEIRSCLKLWVIDVRWVMLYGFRSKFHALFSSAKI